ncbi:MAG: phosphate acyltransferase, partial [Lactobacillus iners]|nr:phosphate acyltransferase [Lactobacillus iners]MCT7782224.1 phosphate acyltransferase [Lactobacillus iners]
HGRSDKRPVYYTLLQIDKMLDEHLIDEFKKYFLNNN